MTEPISTTIVIPAFNEQERLPSTLDALFAIEKDLVGLEIREILLVDDGSSDQTVSVSLAFRDKLPQLRVMKSERNRGKGHAVRLGLQEATSDWVLIADADMSTPWTELLKLSQRLREESAQIAIGSRDLPESDVAIRQSFVREHLGKTFNLLIRILTGLSFRDTQCGFKLVHRESIEAFLSKLTVDRFAWDVEFLMLAQDHGLKIIEVPVSWEHRDASRVHPIFDGFDMATTVLLLQWKRLFGRS